MKNHFKSISLLVLMFIAATSSFSQTIRAKNQNGTSGQMTINRTNYNMVIITSSIVSPLPSDQKTIYYYEATYQDSNLIANDSTLKYWTILFNPGASPMLMPMGSHGDLGTKKCCCHPTNGNLIATGHCTTLSNLDGTINCISCDCSGECGECVIAAGQVILPAYRITLNGIVYQ